MTSEPALNSDFMDFLRELAEAEVAYLVVGGFAVATHGYQRATKDIDIFVRPSIENARRVLRALKAFGAPLHGVDEAELATPGLILQLGVPPRRIDVINHIEGVSFEEANAHPVTVRIGGVAIQVIGLEALLANKRAVGRPEDLKDIRMLTKTRSGRG